MPAIRLDGASSHARRVRFAADGRVLEAPEGVMLAAVLAAYGITQLRTSPREGAPRGAFCYMGVCQECLVRIDGALAQACLTPVREGMRVELRGAI